MASFDEMVPKERERLTKLMDDVKSRRAALDQEAANIQRERRALAAYEAARSGKKKSGGSRAPRGSRRDSLLQIIKESPGGISRGDILDRLGMKGNKSGEQSISNALGNLKKAGKIGAKDGKYMVA